VSVRGSRRRVGVALTGVVLAATSACAGAAVTTSSGTPLRATTCRSGDLAVRVAGSGAEMSQPFLVIVLVNRASTPCRLRGYPTLRAWGHRAARPVTPLPLVVRHGSIYQRQDPGPHRLELKTHEAASFSLGTATAYDGGKDPYLITRLAVTAPGAAAPARLRVDLPATAPAGAAIPVGVTAVEAGRPS
jgi:hypothetical protein